MGGLKSEYDRKSFHDGQTLENISPLLSSIITLPKKPGEKFSQIISREMPRNFPLIIK